jgi:hypothetical protein
MIKPKATKKSTNSYSKLCRSGDDFDPVLPGMSLPLSASRCGSPQPRTSNVPASAPKNLEDLAFVGVRELSELVRTKKVSSLALRDVPGTPEEIRSNSEIHCDAYGRTSARASQKADAEIAVGKYRGPLPAYWGAKDLLAVRVIEQRGARAASKSDD